MFYSGNRYLTKAEMEVNALYIFNYFTAKGWSSNAIAGLLGNLQTESTINPAIWESLTVDYSRGFGLVQWTPATKYIDWAEDNNLDPEEMVSNLKRIEYEVENNIQWGNDSLGNNPPFDFYEFTQSTLPPYNLGMLFLRHYERPLVYLQPSRGRQAEEWFNLLTKGSRPQFPTTEGQSITSPYGWREDPVYGGLAFHAAIDITGNNVNHPIYATQNGVIIDIFYNETSGNAIRIQHTGDPYYSQYQHLDEPSHLSIGDVVPKGQIIGIMGTTGKSTGIHLDFAIALTPNGFYTEAGTIDPEVYLQMSFGGGKIKKKTNFKPWLIPQKRRIRF